LEIVKKFSEVGHSGFSAECATQTLEKLLRFENLTPVTLGDFAEVEVDRSLWQCKRNPKLFLIPDKRGYYSVDNKEKIINFDEGVNHARN
ncbi:hypothetical protein NO1_1961, partial [Candidatus Termititenax aidoneus]